MFHWDVVSISRIINVFRGIFFAIKCSVDIFVYYVDFKTYEGFILYMLIFIKRQKQQYYLCDYLYYIDGLIQVSGLFSVCVY